MLEWTSVSETIMPTPDGKVSVKLIHKFKIPSKENVYQVGVGGRDLHLVAFVEKKSALESLNLLEVNIQKFAEYGFDIKKLTTLDIT